MSRPGLTHERLVALFLLGLLLFTPPFLGIFNAPDRVLGFPTLYLYLFASWTLLIALVALVIESSDPEEGPSRAAEIASTTAEIAAPSGPALDGVSMLNAPTIVTIAFLYLCLLFAIAYYGDKRADRGQSIIANPYIYALSIAVYCTSWTFYGSVGRAASTGVGFLPIYIGPTLTFILGWYLIRKIIRISKVNRITSIADFIASRYGKSSNLGGLVTIIAVVGILPYISLQLKAISMSFSVLLGYPDIVMPAHSGSTPILQDTALYVALIMAAFAILFGTRHIDASEHHEGMVAAIAFESVVKLLAFLAVGIFVTYGVYEGFGDLFSRAAAARPDLAKLFTIDAGTGYTELDLADPACHAGHHRVAAPVPGAGGRECRRAARQEGGLAVPALSPPHQHLRAAASLSAACSSSRQGRVDADTFVLALPMAEHQQTIALLAFIGGLSAATGMIIVETVALSTMVCNDLVMPTLLRFGRLHLSERRDLTGVLLAIRRGAIVVIVLLGYAYVRLIGETYALVTIGLVSFVAAAQFAPAIIGGILWTGATKAGALAGLTGGFLVWIHTLLLPSFARSGWIAEGFVNDGPFGFALLRPYELFGLSGLDSIAHALFWTMVCQCRALRGGLAGDLADHHRTQPGQPVRGHLRPRRRRESGFGAVAPRSGTCGVCSPASSASRWRKPRFSASRASATAASTTPARPMPISYPMSSASSPAPSARPRRASWSPRCCARRCTISTRSCRSSTKPPSSSSTAGGWRKRARSSKPRPRS